MVAFVMVGPVAELVAPPSELRTAGRGFTGRPAGVTGLGGEALAGGSGVEVVDDSEAPAAVDVALVVSVTFFDDVGCSVSVAVCVDIGGSVSVTSPVGATYGEVSALADSVTVAVSVDISRVPVAAPVDIPCSDWVGTCVDVT